MEQDQATLGRYLKHEREKRHVTVEELALFIGVRRPLADALEADDFACFAGRADCLRLVRRYGSYLNLDRAEVMRRFDQQWKTNAAVKRFPKLTHHGDDTPRRRRALGAMRPFAGITAAKAALLLLAGVILLAVPFLLNYLPDIRGMLMSGPPAGERPEPERAAPAGQKPVQPGEGPARETPASGLVKKAEPPAAERRVPPAAPGGLKDAAPKPRYTPAVDPLYTPPGRAERKTAASPGKGGTAVSPVRGGGVVGNRDTKRYHLPGMKYYDKVKAYHRVVFQSEQEAIRAGYVKAPR